MDGFEQFAEERTWEFPKTNRQKIKEAYNKITTYEALHLEFIAEQLELQNQLNYHLKNIDGYLENQNKIFEKISKTLYQMEASK